MSSVKLENLQKHYAQFHALKDINLTIDKGEFIVMVGPSGCGKSTLLKTIAGLETVTSGTLSIGGRDVTHEEPGDRGIAMVFQSYALYPHMTVAENMGFGLRMAKRPQAEIDAAVKRAAEILRITEQLDKRPRQLSGGQRQRVAIGRAITRSPEVFLFDEPLSNLDAALRTQMRVELSTLHARLGSTMIYVTHDQVEAMTMATRIVVLNKGEIEQVGSPLELYTNPKNLFVAGFLGAPRMNFFEGTVADISGNAVTTTIEGLPPVSLDGVDTQGLSPGDRITLGVRPEKLATDGGSSVTIPARIRLVEHLGRETVFYADASPLKTSGSDTGTENITVQLPQIVPFASDAAVTIGFKIADAYLFGPDGRTLTARKPLQAI
ncbi:ABC transporter ATP-binding protein [Rhizobium rosettiformans]|uniref:ABC transporter ATP-binding protein n=1 Tax=Rhizobium rosettiformans TaxID=1368430 RepID=UPI00285BC717|nr:sn-glycerol-3-phosphate ABC transporter ATP-binding protein UgpC [Rhizobium rosettiformans]MDR7030577.1 multiple sugar transport system ATP-binding protein [Rhizobium rosettiformans]MDR7066558.1 multiple sugar transport system ATP-binding protein [Rhizobium rosettiformans]